jgi:hypothetical protein
MLLLCFCTRQPGHLFCMYLKEKLDETLQKVKDHFRKDARLDLPKTAAAISDSKYIARVFDRCANILSALYVYCLLVRNEAKVMQQLVYVSACTRCKFTPAHLQQPFLRCSCSCRCIVQSLAQLVYVSAARALPTNIVFNCYLTPLLLLNIAEFI